MRILHAVGARPNFVKAAPLVREFNAQMPSVNQKILHTGQHYDPMMSEAVLRNLDIFNIDYFFNITRTKPTAQIADILVKSEKVFDEFKPDLTFVYGDVNSTLAITIVAKKIGMKVAHDEAGLRSRDHGMQEEINRIAIDHMSDFLLSPSADANENLRREGIHKHKIKFVGNIMIDTLIERLPSASKRFPALQRELGLGDDFVLVTLHRPSNVDFEFRLQEIMNALVMLSKNIPVVFPVHPRTRSALNKLGLKEMNKLHLCDPFDYLDFLALTKNARLVITDSGGIQEETSFLKVKCLTLRPNTERPITVKEGTNLLVKPGDDILKAAHDYLEADINSKQIALPLWDGKTSERIVEFAMGTHFSQISKQ